MKTATRSLMFVVILALSTFAVAQGPKAATVESAVTHQTFAVGYVDLTKLDFDALENWAVQRLGLGAEEQQEFRQQFAAARTFVNQFRQAGANQVYLVVDPAGFPKSPGLVVIPLAPQANDAALTDLLRGLGAAQSVARVGDVLVFGEKATVDAAVAGQRAARPELAKAFEAAGDAPVAIAIVPPADARKVAEDMMPQLPQMFGGGATQTITRGVDWAVLTLQLPPQPSLNVRLTSPDAASAQAVADVLNRYLTNVQAMLKQMDPKLNADAVIQALVPKVQQNTVLVVLDAPQTDRISDLLAPSLQRARETARIVASLGNTRQIMQGILQWAHDHNGQWPPDLQTLVKDGVIPSQVLRSPRYVSPQREYIYVPAAPDNSSAERIVIYEAHRPGTEIIAAVFADGHAEALPAAKFNELMAKQSAQQAAPAK